MTIYIGIILVFFSAALSYCYAQDSPVNRAEVPLSDPSKPAMVEARVNKGAITVTGYNGKEVIVEARAVTKPVREKEEEKEAEEKEEKKAKKKTKGMYLIRNNQTGLTVVEENNVVVVKVSSFNIRVELDIKVPFKTSLKLKGLNDGFIKVEKVSGELEVNHLNGPLTLKDVSGTVIAHTLNGDVTVTFDKVNLDKPMSFSTLNGDIDVTFPKNAKFNLKMKSERGEIYSDFKLKMQSAPAPDAKPEKKRGRYIVKFDKGLYGLLNGGGEEVKFKTFNGHIYIRAKK